MSTTAELVVMPSDMQSPIAAYTTFYWLFFAQVAGAVLWLAYVAWRNRTAIPLAALGGALVVAYFAPPLLNRLTLVWFPDNIPLAYISAFGMRDPRCSTTSVMHCSLVSAVTAVIG
jgi:hypothetical protein